MSIIHICIGLGTVLRDTRELIPGVGKMKVGIHLENHHILVSKIIPRLLNRYIPLK
jgi:hypothetical protein